MTPPHIRAWQRRPRTVTFAACALAIVACVGRAEAAACNFEIQGDGRVAAVVDARSLRLDDGREVKLAGIEVADRTKAMAMLTALLVGREVTLRGSDDTPDRYGRQPAYAFLEGQEHPVQGELLRQGLALVSSEIADKDCAAALMAAEGEARAARSGTWAEASVIKNAESPDDILAGIGRFMVVEGRVLSVRQAGATTYLNFGRNWTRDFALTISRRIVPAFEAAGLSPKSLENRRIRVRGWVEARRGPRIELLRVGQIEVLGGN
ncbi:thermonuclease family protein [Bradyrhizobium tropiciagri]|uniref:thermonuclease family protein n=1 Tax=Bradyrhizobium tropiciagri TaxID=312253 RepID=UPI001BA5CAC6|nr:thermonuclease family protein [Bradyrhizobium tropiciagri]MBR0894444.1 thermonuclease family protein [Bradyrhizobium tropiciagri]